MAPVLIFTRALLLCFVPLLFCKLSNAFGLPVHIPEYKYSIINTQNGVFKDVGRINNATGITGTSFYVKENATGNNNGSSWQDAYTNLTTALLLCSRGDTIRVARGTYKPTGTSFVLKDSVVMLGGYAGIGNPTDVERDFATYPTILSGEAGNPLFPFDNLSTIITGNLLQKGTLLDGFIIEKGYSNNTILGVGINLWSSSPEIKNCVFRNNSSYNSSLGGSSISCQNNSNPTIINCFFVNNFDFGFATIFIKSNCTPKLINCVFAGNDGRFVVYANQSKVSISSCTFVNNQVGNAVLPREARACFVYAENGTALSVANTIFFNNKFKNSIDTAEISLNTSTLAIDNCITQNFSTGNNYLHSIDPMFKDINNIEGPDNFYFTPDDGLQPQRCSPAVDAGSNLADSAISADLLNRPRIFNAKADIGAYEYQSGNGADILSIANDSIVANREYTDQNGWTNYYKDCQLLISVKKNGQQIGAINDGTFKVIIKTTAGYGSSTGNNLSQAAYVAPAVYWSALNRFWTITPTRQPIDSVLIRFPWSGKDFSDAKAINPMIGIPEQLVFYTVDSPYTPLGINTSTACFFPYYHNGDPSSKSWKYSSIDSVNYAEYYVKKISGGGIGTGSGLNYGPFALPNNECQGSDRIFAATLNGSAYQWQVNSGDGFTNISDNAEYIGSATNQLRVIAPPTSSYGHRFRCQVTNPNETVFTPEIILRFTALWMGNANAAWSKSVNWSCGVVPDLNTDVVIKGGTRFNPLVNADMSCRSLHLSGNATLTLLAGIKLIITGQK